MKRAFAFPGQGSQAVGMGRDLAASFTAARLLFEEVDDALGQHLSRLMFEGPESDLRLTENAQPALMAVSLAAMRVIEEGGFDPSRLAFVAGHSLGEYSALAAARSFRVADAARLLKKRGQAMQRAVPVGEGAMAALLGLDLDAAQQIAKEAARGGGVCTAANDNAPGQVVVSGSREAVERAIAIAAERSGGRSSVLLPVSAPFHCPLMAPAAEAMREALASVDIARPVVPLVANVTASQVTDPEEIRRLLVEQVTGLVRWRESVLFMKEQGVESIVEVGAGRVLVGLIRRIDRGIPTLSLQTPADIEAFFKAI
jgi:[acyl-carrier-protein] S-malonyltransferase